MCDLEGIFFGLRKKIVYNINNNTIEEFINKIEYNIIKINETQYLAKQKNLENDSVITLLLFKNNDGFFSGSAGGIDNIYFTNCGNIIHSWSIPEDSNGNITNATTILDKK